MTDRDYFKGKRVSLIGLGPHGEMTEDAKFLIKSGAFLSVYDLRSEARLKDSLVFLRSIGLANYFCGGIPADDLMDSDLIILSQEYPRNSSFLKPAQEKGIQIEYPETLFFKLAPPMTVVGVIGSVGKSTVISMLAPMLASVCAQKSGENKSNQEFFLANPESGEGILPSLRKAKNGDILLVKIIGGMMSELHNMRISPHVAIFASMPHKVDYKKSPFEILEHQTYNNFLIASDEIVDMTRTYDWKPRAKMLRTKTAIIPPIWELNLRGHDLLSAALVLQAARLFKVSDDYGKKVIESWKPLKGRLELVKKVKGIEFYNDTASVSPHSTSVAISSLARKRNLVLIMGGADTGHDYENLCTAIPQFVHSVILLPGSGTIKYRKHFMNMADMKVISAPGIEEAVRLSRENAKSGDIVLFSPAFAAVGFDASRKERGERFVRAVRGL